MRRRPNGLGLVETLAWVGVPSSLGITVCVRPTGIRPQSNEYWRIWRNGKRDYLHRMVLEWRLGRPIGEGMLARHDCGHAWCVNPAHVIEGTPLENNRDQYRHGTRVAGEKHPQAKLTDRDVEVIRAAVGIPYQILADRFGIHVNHVSDIRRGKRRRPLQSTT